MWCLRFHFAFTAVLPEATHLSMTRCRLVRRGDQRRLAGELELPVSGSSDKRLPLVGGEHEHGPFPVLGVPDADLAVDECDLDASETAAARALHPHRAG